MRSAGHLREPRLRERRPGRVFDLDASGQREDAECSMLCAVSFLQYVLLHRI